MRLWHKDLIPYLPKQQLLGQWRELNSIYANENKHILINYVYVEPKQDLYIYSLYVIKELVKRKYKIKSWQNFYKYFGISFSYSIKKLLILPKPIKPYETQHDAEYLKICCWNLWEKYIKGQSGFTAESVAFIKSVIYSDVEIKNTELEDLKIKLETWYQLLSCSGINSKKIVKAEIKKVLEETEND